MSDQYKQAFQLRILCWPTPQEYNEAVQNLEVSVADKELQAGEPELTVFGLPRPITGAFASVYRIHCGEVDWAVRCFLYNFSDQRDRYASISEHLKTNKLPYTVAFEYLQNGIMLHGQWYPILKMQWAEGWHLSQYVENNLSNPEAIADLAQKWREMTARLRSAGIAHGDLQHGNVLVDGGELRLVDYDGMFVPALSGLFSNELGHRNYQHPARAKSDYGSYLDNFSAWVIYVSLICLSRDPALWRQLRAGDECMLFRQSDFTDPLNSRAFFALENHADAEVAKLGRWMRSLINLPVAAVPDLSVAPEILIELPPVNAPSSFTESAESNLPDWMRPGTGRSGKKKSKRERGAARRARRMAEFGQKSGDFHAGAGAQSAGARRAGAAGSGSASASKSGRKFALPKWLRPVPKGRQKSGLEAFFSSPELVMGVLAVLGVVGIYAGAPSLMRHDAPKTSEPVAINYARNDLPSDQYLYGAVPYLDQGDYIQAAFMYRKALAAMAREGLVDTEKYATTEAGLASCLASDKTTQSDAEEAYSKAYNVFARRKGPDSEEVANVLTARGELELSMWKFPEAKSTFEKVLAIQERLHGRNSLDLIPALLNLAKSHQCMHHNQLAINRLKQALVLAEGRSPQEEAVLLNILEAMKENYQALGKQRELKKVSARITALQKLDKSESVGAQ